MAANSFEEDRGILDDLILELFDGTEGPYLNWHRLCRPGVPASVIRWDVAKADRDDVPRKQWLLDTHRVWWPLHYSTMWDLHRITLKLLQGGHDPNALCGGNTSALIIAAEHSSKQSLKILLDQGAFINHGDWVNLTAAHKVIQCHAEDIDLLNLFLHRGAYCNSSSPFFGTSLQLAAFRGSTAAAREVLRAGADPNEVFVYDSEIGYKFSTALQCAAFNGHNEMMDLLLQLGADIDQRTGELGTALHAAAIHGGVNATKHLIAKGANISSKSGRFGSVLSAAGYGGSHDTVELLLESGHFNEELAQILAPDHPAESPSKKSWVQVPNAERRLLMDRFIRDKRNKLCPSLIEAAKIGDVEAATRFLVRGDHVDDYQRVEIKTPLNWAAHNGHLETVRLLLDHGAQLGATDRSVRTPLMNAALMGHVEVVKLLLARGASVNRRNDHGTALMMADAAGVIVIVEFLKDSKENGFVFEREKYSFDNVTGRFVKS
jgi:ankyrin repeat protein